MKKYLPRIADGMLRDKLAGCGTVLIEGAKWCGKTSTAEQQAKSVLYMQDPRYESRNKMLAELDMMRLLDGENPRLVDEWQVIPKLWDAVRFAVDRKGGFGHFILTGSSTPADMSEVMHSGAGRITRMLMRPMSLFESGDSTGTISLRDLFHGEKEINGTAHLGLDDISFLLCRGGWPASVGCDEKIALQQAVNYYDITIDHDISAADGISRSRERAQRLMENYTRFVGSQTSTSAIHKAMIEDGSTQISLETVSSYLDIMKKIFVIEEMPSWNPNLRSKTTIMTRNTRYFTDPSIGCAALGIGPADLVNDPCSFGLFFENLCIRDLRIYADALDGNVYHFRNRNGLECDAVVHLRNGAYGLVEIKLGGKTGIEEGVKTLNRLEADLDTSKMPGPSFKMILTATDNISYHRNDGVMVVPIGALRD